MAFDSPRTSRQELVARRQKLCDYLVDLTHSVDGERARATLLSLLSSNEASTSRSCPTATNFDPKEALNTLSSFTRVTPLHVAVWRNDLETVDLLLSLGASPDVQDGESGWTSLHRACYFGHLGLVVRLLKAKAKVNLEDRKGRTAFDLLAHEVSDLLGETEGGEVFSWGLGTNYQLGTGCLFEQPLPTPVAPFGLGGEDGGSLGLALEKVCQVSAAKYHSCALTASGQLYTWGFGRGGRLGHEAFHVHSGMQAVLEPRLVRSLEKVRVVSVSAAKHHTVCLSNSGDVWSWGNNKEGRLGYSGVDTQPSPRKVGSIKAKVVCITAANKHTAVVTAGGDLLTWGSNSKGQLGYGSTEAGYNGTPRIVEAMKSGSVQMASASKNHTVVLLRSGEVWTFGHKVITPAKVAFGGRHGVEFHNDHSAIFRPEIVEVAAGASHSSAVSSLGVVFVWNSFDPELKSFELKLPDAAVSVSAGKERTCICTQLGNVYSFEGVPRPLRAPATYKNSVDIQRVPIRRASAVAVGEKHSLAVQRIFYPPVDWVRVDGNGNNNGFSDLPVRLADLDLGELDIAHMRADIESSDDDCDENDHVQQRPGQIPSLHSLCQAKIAESCVNTRVLCSLIEFSATFRAMDLKEYCEKMAVANLDVVAAVRGSLQSHISIEEIMNLEGTLPRARIMERRGKVCLDLNDSREKGNFIKLLFSRSTSNSAAMAAVDVKVKSLEDILGSGKKRRNKRNKKPVETPTKIERFVWADTEPEFPTNSFGSAGSSRERPIPEPVSEERTPPPTSSQEPTKSSSRPKPKLKKGGLSLFLQGGLDGSSRARPGPDLGGYNYSKFKVNSAEQFPSLSLDSKRKGKGNKSVSLSSIMREQHQKQQEEEARSAEKNFFGFGWSPEVCSSPDFRAIQNEQLEFYKVLWFLSCESGAILC